MLYPSVVAVIAFAANSVALGLAGVWQRPGRSSRAVTIFALGLLSVPGALLIAGQPRWVAAAAAAPVMLYLLLLVLRTFHDPIVRGVDFLTGARRLHACLLLAAGPLVAGVLIVRSDEPEDVMDFAQNDPFGQQALESLHVAPDHAYTDRKSPIVLLSSALEERRPALTNHMKRISQSLSLRVLRTDLPDATCNCHGWIFTGGRFWVRSEQVNQILHDNDYRDVGRPRPGDLIVYRDEQNLPVHTGVVRVAEPDLVLVESKWGSLGRFVHAPVSQGYSLSWTYYRSSRPGHLLRVEPEMPERHDANAGNP
jgi:hypothetical protein